MNWWTLMGVTRPRSDIRSIRNSTPWDRAQVGSLIVRALLVTLSDGTELRVPPAQVTAFNTAVGRTAPIGG